MPNNHYLAGRKKEYKVMQLLEDEGYITFRTAGSHTPVDVLAFFGGKAGEPFQAPSVVWIQVKKSTSPMSNEEWNLLYSTALCCGVTPVLAEYTPRKGIKFYQLLGKRAKNSHTKFWTEWQP